MGHAFSPHLGAVPTKLTGCAGDTFKIMHVLSNMRSTGIYQGPRRRNACFREREQGPTIVQYSLRVKMGQTPV